MQSDASITWLRDLKGRFSQIRPTPQICECGNHAWASATRGFVVLVSAEDAHLLRRKWNVFCRDGVVASVLRTIHFVEKGRRRSRGESLHVAVLPDIPIGMIRDHANRNPLDNRRHNIRAATHRQNCHNKSRNKNKTGSFKGVHRDGKKYHAQICVNGKSISIGKFASEVDAALAYDKAARQHFGEFAATNFEAQDA